MSFDNRDNIIDTREVQERFEELESELEDAYDSWCSEEEDKFDDAVEEIENIVRDERGDEEEDMAVTWLEVYEKAQEIVNAGEVGETAAELVSLYMHKGRFKIDRTFDQWRDDIEMDPNHGLYSEACEFQAIKDLKEDAEGYCDWIGGESLIRWDHFEDYAKQLAEDMGAISGDEKWPLNCIDWEKAVDELKQDYTEVTFDGIDYFVRTC